MTRHATVEVLSSYLDSELENEELRSVEDHLEECDDCRARLSGLRSVVDALHRLERQQPPRAFGGDFYRRLADDRKTPRLRRAMERLLERNALHSAVLIGFAVIIALAAIGYMLSQALDMQQNRGETRVILVPPGIDETGGPVEGSVRAAAGRRFELEDGRWWAEDVDRSQPVDLHIDPSTEEGALWLAQRPELIELNDLGGPVVLLDESDRIVEVRTGSATDNSR